jgi:SAM-dependent methyltransferase
MAELSDRAGLRDQRRKLLHEARGTTLELHGFGTGRNLAFYTEAVGNLVLLQAPYHMDAKLPRRVAAFGRNARVVNADDARFPFEDRAFDTVVATLALCFAPDLPAAVVEIARVLRPRGRLLFLEHVRSVSPGLARWQDRLAPFWRTVAVGCHCERDTLAYIEASPLAVDWVERGVLPLFPPLVRPLILGAASAPA